jgi:hypothetical protein
MNLTSVDIIFQGDSFAGQPGFALIAVDNINLQAVPIPATVWLFGSGLGLLGWIRRKHNC